MDKNLNAAFQIKGIREGLLIVVGPGDWSAFQQQLTETITQNCKFFEGARLAIDVGSRTISASETGKLRDVLADLGATLWAVLSKSPETLETARMLGLATQISLQKSDNLESPNEPVSIPGENAMMVQRTIRSGMKIFSTGHVIIMGDINPGGEVIACGSIIIWGRCRGVVHAGAQGNVSAVISALDLSPTQLRIADCIAISPKRKGKPQPETASIVDERVVAESWNPKTR